MNAMEQLLQDDLHHLIDRIAATTQVGLVTDCLAQRAELYGRLCEAETRLSTARLALLHGYVAWREALQECGDLWALADLGAEATSAGERRAA